MLSEHVQQQAAGLYKHFQAGNYGAVAHALDDAVGNITAEMKAQDIWGSTLLLFTSDNGGDCAWDPGTTLALS